jgi:hypothetical protein
MTLRPLSFVLAGLVLAGCGAEPEPAPLETAVTPAQVLPNIPIPPGGEALGSEGGAEAAALLLSTPMQADSVADYYRDVLSKPPYRLINESKQGVITSFYVEQGSDTPMWVNVEALEAGGTLVRITGARAAADSVTAPTDSAS